MFFAAASIAASAAAAAAAAADNFLRLFAGRLVARNAGPAAGAFCWPTSSLCSSSVKHIVRIR